MTTFAGSLLSTLLLLGQLGAEKAITGTVVDRDGRPVAGAEVRLSCGMAADGTAPTLESIRTDREGRFRLAVPTGIALRAELVRGGLGEPAGSPRRRGRHADAEDRRRPDAQAGMAAPRTVTIRGRDGNPVAGARVTLRSIHGAAPRHPAPAPRRAGPAVVRRDRRTEAALADLSPRDDVVAVRIAVDGRAAQDFQLTTQLTFGKDAPAEYAISLEPPVRIAGRVVDGDAGRSRADGRALVQGPDLDPADPVSFPDGPIRTAADGSFRTTAGLAAGSSYRLVVRSPGHEPILSAWTTAVERPQRLGPGAPAARTIAGRVVDRRGQRSPASRSSRRETVPSRPRPGPTTPDVRPRGVPPGPVFLFARGRGFRFHGRLVQDEVPQVEVVLTRETEQPARSMATLPTHPPEESRALARKLLEPCLAFALSHGDDRRKYFAFHTLVKIDPAAVLDKLDSIAFQYPATRDGAEPARDRPGRDRPGGGIGGGRVDRGARHAGRRAGRSRRRLARFAAGAARRPGPGGSRPGRPPGSSIKLFQMGDSLNVGTSWARPSGPGPLRRGPHCRGPVRQ